VVSAKEKKASNIFHSRDNEKIEQGKNKIAVESSFLNSYFMH
jgi:hypothetical protein